MDFSSIFITVVLFVTLHVGSNVTAQGACPPYFERHEGQCYKVMGIQASWQEAKAYCKIIGGDLAYIHSANVQAIIAGLVKKYHGIIDNERYWVDGSDMLKLRKFRWMRTNGNSIPFLYTNWHINEPNNIYENCLEVRYDFQSQWNDLDCLTRLSFICQTRIGNGDEMKFNAEMGR